MIPPSALTSLCCLPCGCFVDLDKLFAYEPEATEKRTGRRFLLCPFCEATFLAVDFQRWAKTSIQEISEALYTCVCRPPCTMIKFGQSLLEVAEICEDCGAPICRATHRAADWHVKFHLKVPEEMIVEVRN